MTVLLTEAEIVAGLGEALQRRELPESYSYWFPTSVRAWLDLCSDGAYRNYVRSRDLVLSHAAEIVAAARRRAARRDELEIVSLGAGQADKDVALLREARATGAAAFFRPVDASQMLLELACAAAASRSIACEAVKGDLARPAHLAAIDALRAGRPALWLLLGNTLGAFDPQSLCAALRRVVGPRDSLILDAEILDGDATIAGYDNPLNRRFAFAPLAAMGLAPEHGELRFALQQGPGIGFWRLAKSFQPVRDVRLTLGGSSVALEAGEPLHMGHSGKFSRDGFRRLLDAAGFEPLGEWASDDGRFVMAHLG